MNSNFIMAFRMPLSRPVSAMPPECMSEKRTIRSAGKSGQPLTNARAHAIIQSETDRASLMQMIVGTDNGKEEGTPHTAVLLSRVRSGSDCLYAFVRRRASRRSFFVKGCPMYTNRDMNRPSLRVDSDAYPAGAALLSAHGVPNDAFLPAERRNEAGELSGTALYSLLPGFCDVHVHFREPGYSYKETIRTGALAAAHGGYTAVCSMPNLNPVPDSPEHLRVQTDIIRRDACIAVYPYGALTVGERGEAAADLAGMAADAVAFSDDGKGVQSVDMMRTVMCEAARLGKVVAAHCEDNSLLHGGYIHDGAYARSHGHRGICSESEYLPIARDIELCRETGCAYHVCHISTRESVALIRRAKAEGVNITCETAPHYLVLDEGSLREDGRFKMNPPLRSAADREALLEGLIDGTIDMIATDHAPHTDEEKSRGLEGSPFGVVGLETAFPVLYTHLVRTGILSLETLLERMVWAPRRRFGLPCDPESVGVSLWDLSAARSVNPAEFLGMGHATPFAGETLYGVNRLTLWHGRAVYDAAGGKENAQ